jgi:hypothetical protein
MAIDTSFLYKKPGSTQPEKRAAAIQDAAAQQDDQLITGDQSYSIDTSFLYKTPTSAAIPPETEAAAPAEEESMWKGVGTSISEGFKRILPTIQIATLEQIMAPIPRSLMNKLTETERKEIAESRQREQAAQPTRELSLLEQGARGAVVSGAQMIPGIVASIVTKNPTIALSSAGIQTGVDSYGSAIAAGKSHEDALKYASVDAAIEVATEKLPTDKLLGIFGVDRLSDLRKQLVGYTLSEVPGEQAATLGQSINAYVNGLDEELSAAKTNAEKLRIQAERQAVTAISTVLAAGAVTGAGLAVQKLAAKPEEPAAPPAPPASPTTAEAQPTPVAPVGEPAATAETTTVSQPSTTVVSGEQAAAPTVAAEATTVAPAVADQGVTAPAAAPAVVATTAAAPEVETPGVISTAALKQQLVEVDAEAAARAAEQALATTELPEGLTVDNSVTENFGPDDTRFAAFESATDKELYVLGKLNRRPAKTPELTETARQLTSKVAEALGIPVEEVAQRAEATRVATQNGLSGVQAGAVYRVPTGITTPPVSPLMQLASDQIGEKFSLPEGEKVVIPEAPVDPVRTKIASVIKDAFGVDVVWASLPKGGKVKTTKGRELVAINGARIAGTNAILLDANNYSFLNTLGHELTHVLETQYPQLYQQLITLAKAKVSKKFQNQLRKEVANDAEFNSELVAEMVGEQSTDPKFWQEVFDAAGDQTSAQGFLDALNKIIDRILSALQGYQPMVVQSRKDALAVRQAAQQAFQQWITARQQAAQQVAADQQAAVQAAAAVTRPAPAVNPFLVGTSLDPNAPKPAELGPPKVPPSRQAQVNIGQKGRRFVTFAADLDKDLFELGAKLKKAAKTLSKSDRESADARLVRFMAVTGLPRAEMIDVAKNYRDAVVKAAGAVQEDGTYEAPATNIGERRAVEERKVEERREPQRERADEQVREVRQDREQPPVEQAEGAEAGGRDRAAEGRPQPEEVADEEVIRDLPQFSRKRPAVDPDFADSVAEDVGLNAELSEATSLKYQTGKSGEDQFNTPVVGGLTNTVLEIERARREGTLGQLDLDSESDRKTVAKMLAAEVVAAVRAGGGAKEWYDKTIRRTLAMASLKFPELSTDKEAQTAFRLSVAITSQGLNVEDNLKFAMQVYGEYRKSGTFPLKGQGKNGGAMVSNFQLANTLMEKMGMERFSRFLETDFVASELNAIGFNIDELADEKILGSSVFGPKIGFGFYSNLSGNFEPVTIDMWFMRTIGRLIGKLRAFDAKLFASQRDKFRAAFAVEGVNGIFINSRNMAGSRLFSADLVQNAATDDDAAVTLARLVTRAHERDFKVNRKAYDNKTRVKSSLVNNAANMLKSLDKPKDAPSSGSERRNLRDIVRQTVSLVEGVVGERIPPASMQALVWYPEQELYKSFGVKLRVTSQDYAGAIRKILEKEGYSGRELSAAAESGSRGAQRVAGQPLEAEDAGVVGQVEQPDAAERAGRQLTARERERLLVSEVIKRYRQSSAEAQGSYKIRSAGDGRRIRVLSNDAKAEYKPVITFKNSLGAVGKPAPTMYELDGGAPLFRQAIQDSKNNSKFGAAVYVYDEADYANMRLFISEDGKSGFALKGNDIVSVFSGQKGSANAMLQLAVDQGGQRLDAFDTVLPELYADNGFKVVARVKWNDEYSPEGWDKATFAKYNNGEPDVVFMVYDPTNASELGGKTIENYDDGVAAQEEAIGKKPIQFSRVRSETNADGKQIASTPEFIQNFWNWFGDSKLVDRRGRPKVMYHGTIPPTVGAEEFIDQGISVFRRGTGGAIFVSPDERVANTYAGPGGSVYPLYVRAENPFDFENPDHVKRVLDIWESNNVGIRETREQAIAKGKWQMIENVEIQDAIKQAGFDSYYVKETGAKNLALYDPSQLKSAVGNVGEFSPERPEIQFSRVMQGNKYWLPKFGRLKRLLRAFENEIYQSKNVQEAVKKQGGVLTESTEIESALHRMYGRAGNRIDTFRRDVLDPIIKKASELNVSLEDVELYLYASHAKEANKRIASIDSKTQDGGSGMTNAEADQVMADLRQDMPQFLRIKSVADDVQNITKMTQAVLLNGDLVSPADIAAWNATYNYYVPLKTFEQVDDAGRSTGNGRFDLGAAFSKRRKGRSTKAGAIFENILGDYEEAVVAVERNNVRKAWLKFILDNKDSALWQVNKPVMQKYISKNPTEQVRYRLTIQKDSETLPVKVGGEVYHMVIKDPAVIEELQMTSILSQFPDAIKEFLEAHGKITRSLAKLNTTLSPSYIAPALWRDTLTALATIGIEKNIFSAAKLAASLPKSAYTVWKASRNGAWTGDWKRWYDMYTADGGAIGSIDLRTIESRRKDLLNAYREAQANIGDVRTYPDLALRYLGKLEQFMMSVNGALEGSARLAAYKIAIENGESRLSAVKLAKDITVNFNRRGRWAPVFGSMYMFFNAAVQGSRRSLELMFKTNRGRVAMAGLVAFGIALAEMSSNAVGDDDEPYWDKPSFRTQKLKNFIFGFSPDGTPYQFVLPYGIGFFVNLGYAISDLRRGVDPYKVASFLRDSAAIHFSPLGSADNMTTFFSPTVLDYFMVIATGEKSDGTPLMPEDYTGVTPDSQRMFNNTMGTIWEDVSKFLYEVSDAGLGSKVGQTFFDISPETLKFTWSTAAGGLGTFISDVITSLDVATQFGYEEALNKNTIPIVKSFYRKPAGRYESSAFYENAEEVKRAVSEWKALDAKTERSPKEEAYMARIESIKDLESVLNDYRKLIKEARARDLEIQEKAIADEERENLTEEQKDELRKKHYESRKKIAEQIRTFQRDFNKAFYDERRAIAKAEKAEGEAEE